MQVSMIDRIRATVRLSFSKFLLLIWCLGANIFCSITCSYAQDLGQNTNTAPMSGISDTIIFDPNTNLALFGYDPVAYFSDGQSILGQKQFEVQTAGLVWRFKNQGNRQAFLGNPTLYTPQFGGYDGFSVAKGRIVGGNPMIFLTLDTGLYFFRDIEHKKLFEESEALQMDAMQKWLEIKSKLIKP